MMQDFNFVHVSSASEVTSQYGSSTTSSAKILSLLVLLEGKHSGKQGWVATLSLGLLIV